MKIEYKGRVGKIGKRKGETQNKNGVHLQREGANIVPTRSKYNHPEEKPAQNAAFPPCGWQPSWTIHRVGNGGGDRSLWKGI